MLQPHYPSLRGKRVLLVEDDNDLGNALQRVLEDSGCELVGAESSEASYAVSGAQMDVALIDLPRDARRFQGLIRQLCEQRIPVVLIAHDLTDELPRSMQPRLLLTKPFTEAELLERITEALLSVARDGQHSRDR